jgi:hypothetical protein
MSGRSSVQDAVRIIVTRNPYLYRGIRMRVVNYSALARYIQQEVESNLGDEVDPNTIVTAIMRLSNQVLEPEEPRSPLAGSRLNLVTGITEVVIRAPPVKHTEIIGRILVVKAFDSYTLSLRQTSTQVRILTNSPDADRIKEELGDFDVEIRRGFAELHVRLHADIGDVERVLTMVVDVLAQNGVYVMDSSITEDEISLVFRENDSGRAFETLRVLSS